MPELTREPRTRLRHARGEADPVLVMMSLVVVVLVVAGITAAIVAAQRWSTVYATDAAEQTGEDSARLAWMADVGTATAVVPAARPGTTAAESVRFDDATRAADWPAGASCRAVTWWLDDPTPADVSRPNSRDETGTRVDLVKVHRQVQFYAGTSAADPARCNTSLAPVLTAVSATPIDNALPGAGFTYTNGHLRDLVFADPARPGVESCQGASTAAELASCAARSQAEPVPGRSAWEWADPEPAQVLLQMTTDQAGMGAQFADQVGWREGVGRRELTGDAASDLTDTLSNPTSPGPATTSPAVTAVVATAPDDPAQDRATVTRSDTRDLDGYELRCVETLNGAPTGAQVIPDPAPLASPPTAVTIPGTRPGYGYSCAQQGWVNAVVTTPAPSPATAGSRFPGGESGWSPYSPVATRRPVAPVNLAGALDGSARGAFTWQASAGADTYDVRYRLDADPTWVDAPSQTATSWTSAPLGWDSLVTVQVRAVNEGGASPWSTAQVARQLQVPAVTIEPGTVGKSTYTASWAHVPGFDPAVHTYQVQYKTAASQTAWQSAPAQTSTSFTVPGSVLPGRAVSVQVRAVGVNAGTSPWSAPAATTRPVAAPAAPVVSVTTVAGALRSSAASVTCEAGTSTQYAVLWDDGTGWSGWGTAQTSDHAVGEGTTVWVTWKARCVPGEGSAAEGPAAPGQPVTLPYTAPPTPTMYNPSDGPVGTNITFDWSDTGGYYQVVNSAGSHRAYTTGSALTVARESGSTCAQVRAARNSTAAGQGVWSGWSSLQCGTTTIPVPQAPSSGWANVSGSSSMGIYASWSDVSYATKYAWEVYYRSGTTGTYTRVGSGTSTGNSGSQIRTGNGYAYACVTPGNATGWGTERCSNVINIPDW